MTWSQLTEKEKYLLLTMEAYGSDFEKFLAKAFESCSDEEKTLLLKAFQKNFDKYVGLAEHVREGGY